MKKQTFEINDLRVAAPCSVPWETMAGDERQRLCERCRLNVYNFSEMTEREVQKLIAGAGGRVCGRLFRRFDGTILTKDCPVGIRAYQKRAARFAGAALTALLGLFSVSFGQKEDKKGDDRSRVNIVRTVGQRIILSGTIMDPEGALVGNAVISLRRGETLIRSVNSDENGEFSIYSPASGEFTLEVRSPGFEIFVLKKIKIADNEKIRLEIFLHVNLTELVGIIVTADPLIDMTKTDITTTIAPPGSGRSPD